MNKFNYYSIFFYYTVFIILCSILMKIPKIIHQIWFKDVNKIPSKYYNNITSIHKLASDWTYKYWNLGGEELYDLCLQYSEQCAETFKNYKNTSHKLSLAKYVILYNMGGMFVDMDCEILKSLNAIPELKSKNLIISRAPDDHVRNFITTGRFFIKLLNDAVILSSPKNIYIKAVIDGIIKNSCIYTKHTMTCKLEFSEQLILTNALSRYEKDPDVLILDSDYFDPCFSFDGCCKISKRAIIDHKHDWGALNNPIAKILGCILYLKESYDHILFCIFITTIILYILFKI